MTSQDSDLEASKALSLLESSLDHLEAAGFQKMVYEDFYDALADLIRRIFSPGPDGSTLKSSALLEAFQNAEGMSHLITHRIVDVRTWFCVQLAIASLYSFVC